jgi:predicted anti-sigma-YlaC factor YlaD
MTDRCPTGFDEALLSGCLDGELTQIDVERVHLHLEDCAACRSLFDELRRVREASRSTPFQPAPDDQWDERPRGPLSLVARRVGWVMVVAWVVVVAAFAAWQLATSPEGLGVKLLIFSCIAGPALLLLSVLVDRLRTLKTDRYRRVLK